MCAHGLSGAAEVAVHQGLQAARWIPSGVEVEQADAFGQVQDCVRELGLEGPQDGDRVAVIAD